MVSVFVKLDEWMYWMLECVFVDVDFIMVVVMVGFDSKEVV